MRIFPATVAAAIAALVVAAADASAPDAVSDPEQIVIDIEIGAKGAVSKRVLPMPNQAGKLFKRYLALANAQCPVTIMKNQGDDKGVAWIVGRDERSRVLVFVTSNMTNSPYEMRFRLSSKSSLTPVYRRVVSDNKGRTWHRIAFEPPHFNDAIYASASSQGVIKIPPYSVQTVTVRLI